MVSGLVTGETTGLGRAWAVGTRRGAERRQGMCKRPPLGWRAPGRGSVATQHPVLLCAAGGPLCTVGARGWECALYRMRALYSLWFHMHLPCPFQRKWGLAWKLAIVP